MQTAFVIWQILAPFLVTGVVALLVLVFRKAILTWVAKSVEHRFDVDLENVRSELRNRESQIGALTANVLSGRASREAALQQRRVAAAEKLWAAAVKIAPYRGAIESMATLNLAAVTERVKSDGKLRQFMGVLAKNYDLSQVSFADADNERLFLSELAWAYFAALRAICAISVFQLKLLDLGEDPREIANSEAVVKLLKAALPAYGEFIDQHGAAAYSALAEPLEMLLLAELRRILEGKDQDQRAIANAADIIQSADAVMSETLETANKSGVVM